MIEAVFDACVLYSAPLRGFLLHLASSQLIVPYWSEEIQEEWTRNLLQNRPDLVRENLEGTHRKMDFHFPRGRIHGYEPITSTLTLPDPNDKHVLAVAIHTGAKYIVTFNLKDFPKTVLQPYEIEALTPDTFVFQLIQKTPDRVCRATRNHRLSLTRPPKTVDEYLATLEKQGFTRTVAFLREHEAEI